jgi:hypothetical protein
MANPLRRIPRPAWCAFVLASVLVVALAAFLTWFKRDMLRGPIARQASLALGRPVRISWSTAGPSRQGQRPNLRADRRAQAHGAPLRVASIAR